MYRTRGYERGIAMRFTLKKGRWYACEFIGDEFIEDRCSYSPIKIYSLIACHNGQRRFDLAFYHANYPEGVRDKEYELVTLERGRTFILAKSIQHDPLRILQIYDIDENWVRRHFAITSPPEQDIQHWLDSHS